MSQSIPGSVGRGDPIAHSAQGFRGHPRRGRSPDTGPSPRRRRGEGRVLAVAAGAAFLALLDATVANLAVTDVRSDLAAASVGAATWIITIYAVTFAALLAPAGRLADVVGRRTLLIVGVLGFTVTSAACAIAPSLEVLLVARGLQGAAAALMIPASLAVVLADTAPERRAAAIGAWSAAGALAAAAGPAIGGVLVDAFGWRALFLIQLPVAAAILAGARDLPMLGIHRRERLPDWAGTLGLGAGIGGVALGIAQGNDWGWGAPATLAALGGGLVLVAAALARSAGHPVPAIQTGLWRHRPFAWANLASLFYGAALFPLLLLGVLFLVSVWGYSPLEAGLAMTPGAIIAAVVALKAAPHVARVGAGAVIALGAASLATACALCALVMPEDPALLTFWLPTGVLMGIGTGAITTGTSSAAALSVPAQHFATGTGLNQTARQIGGALGVAGLATLLDGRLGADIGPYTDVYWLCAIATALVGVAALGFHRAAHPAPVTARAASVEAAA